MIDSVCSFVVGRHSLRHADRKRSALSWRRALMTILCLTVVGESHARYQTPSAIHSDRERDISSYIKETWTTLTRSTSECGALTDVKVLATPHLYIPADIPIPAGVQNLENKCHIQVLRLPKLIRNIGDLRVSGVADNGLLYLPFPYVVPGGRFNEMYGWDSYFIELGLLRDSRADLVRDILENFFFEIDHYGGVLNANRTYYLSRSQPPFLATMVLDFYRAQNRADQETLRSSGWLAHAYMEADRAYSLWISPSHLAGKTGLARYYDYEEGPVPEMSDDDDYYTKVIEWFQQHPEQARGFLDVHGDESRSRPAYCSLSKLTVCGHSHIGNLWLSKEFFRGDRADRESGFDTTFRFGPFSGSTHHYAPVCLNSLLFRYESEMASIAEMLGRKTEEERWTRRAARRRAAIDRYLWNPTEGLYFDYDFVRGKQSSYLYASAFYPLWSGAADERQAAALTHNLSTLEQPYGISMSRNASGLQWDSPFGWAPCNWIVVDGLWRYGYRTDALRIANHFVTMVQRNYAIEGTIREKYDVRTGSSAVVVNNGYATNVSGFGWTNGVYLMMTRLIKETDAGLATALPSPEGQSEQTRNYPDSRGH